MFAGRRGGVIWIWRQFGRTEGNDLSSRIPASIFQGVRGLPRSIGRLDWDFQTGSHRWNLSILHQLLTRSSVTLCMTASVMRSSVTLCMNFGASTSGVSMAGVQHYPTSFHEEAESM